MQTAPGLRGLRDRKMLLEQQEFHREQTLGVCFVVWVLGLQGLSRAGQALPHRAPRSLGFEFGSLPGLALCSLKLSQDAGRGWWAQVPFHPGTTREQPLLCRGPRLGWAAQWAHNIVNLGCVDQDSMAQAQADTSAEGGRECVRGREHSSFVTSWPRGQVQPGPNPSLDVVFGKPRDLQILSGCGSRSKRERFALGELLWALQLAPCLTCCVTNCHF